MQFMCALVSVEDVKEGIKHSNSIGEARRIVSHFLIFAPIMYYVRMSCLKLLNMRES